MKPKFVVCANLRKISGALECEQSVFILQESGIKLRVIL